MHEIVFLPDSAEPAALVARLRENVAPGSHLAISHGTSFRDERMDSIGDLYRRTPMPFFTRSAQQVGEMLAGWEILPPGVVTISDWHPEPDDHVPARPGILAAVARR